MRRAALLGLLFLPACEASCSSCASSAGSGAPPPPAASAAPAVKAVSTTPARPAPAAPADAPAEAPAPAAEPAAEVQPVSAAEAGKLRCGKQQAKADAALRRWPARPLEELRRGGDARGGFDTEGVVTDTFLPAPCPEGAQCKPQPPPHVALAPLDGSSGTFIGVTGSAGEITIGERLRLSVILCGSRTYGATINEGEIAAIER